MSKKIRLFLFLFFTVSFLILGPYIIFYSLGYKIDFENKRIVKTGGIYLEIQPSQAEVFIDGKLRGKTGLFFNSVLISGLLPKKYEILVKKEGYHSWKKELEIEREKVTKANNIFLIKENPQFEVLEEKVVNYFLSPDNKKIVIQRNTEGGIEFKVLTIGKKNGQIISLPVEDSNLLNLLWAPDGKSFLITLEVRGTLKHFISESLDLPTPALIPLSLSKSQEIKNISFHPINFQELFYLENQTLFSENLNEKQEPNKILENVLSYDIFGNNIYWLASSGFLYRSDLDGKIIDVLNSEPLPVEKKKAEIFEITATPYTTFLKKGGKLFFLNPAQKTFCELHGSVNNFLFSPDSKKIVFFNDYEIWLIEVDSLIHQNSEGKIEKVFLSRFSKKINNCFWLNSYYLVLNTSQEIKVLEIDIRDRLNIVSLISFKNPKIFWNQNDKKLYILSEETLFVSEKLIP